MTHILHPHIIRIWGIATIDDRVHVVMERLDGGSLKRHLQTAGAGVVKLSDLERVSHQVANALAYLSSIGCVHRDLATRNVLIPDKSLKGKCCVYKSAERQTNFGMSANRYLNFCAVNQS